MKMRGAGLLAALFAVSLSVPAMGSSAAHAATVPGAVITFQNVNRLADTSFVPNGGIRAYTTTSNQVNGPEVAKNTPERDLPKSTIGAPGPLPAPAPAGSPVSSSTANLVHGFEGLNHRDQRLADNGNQYSLEPPDQGLCTGNGYVIEGVNLALSVYSTSGGKLTTPTSANEFFLHDSILYRNHHPLNFGEFTSDPKCYYDPATQRFFITVLSFGVDYNTGQFNGQSTELIAVSKTAVPILSASNSNDGQFYVYSFHTEDNTSDAGTSDHAGCPCFGDQPLIGADSNGFYESTNEFPIFQGGFNGAQIYALPKQKLVAGTSTFRIVHYQNLVRSANEGYYYSVQPATSPTAPSFSQALQNNGTEYFLSSFDFFNTGDNRIGAWAMTNTSLLNGSLASAAQVPVLNETDVATENYYAPPPAYQKPGPYPQGQYFGDPENYLNTNDDRMNQAVFADGKLTGAVNTGLANASGNVNRSGIAYFVVTPSFSGSTFNATLSKGGYVSVTGNNVMFPSIGINASGQGAMAFSMSGPDYYPTSAYTLFNVNSGAGAVQIAALGQKPADGFTGYPQYGGGQVERWGDYSAAVADASGNIWMASEYIQGDINTTPGTPGAELANWDTYVYDVAPGSSSFSG